MRNTLKECPLGEGLPRGLYNGRIIPWERRSPPNDRQREILGKLEDEERYFMAKMSPNDCERFEALSRLQTELSITGEEQLFSYAFTLGLLLAMDVVKEFEVVYNSRNHKTQTGSSHKMCGLPVLKMII